MSKVQSAITRQIVRGSVRERSNTNPHPSIFQPTVSSSITASFITPSFLSRVLTDSLLPKAHWRPSLCECLTATVICSFILLSGCGSSKRSTPIHDVVDPNKAKQIIPILGREKVLDSVPIAGLSDFAPNQRNFYLAHLSKPESKVAYSGDCQNLSGKDLVKATKDLAEIEYTTIIEHHNCHMFIYPAQRLRLFEKINTNTRCRRSKQSETNYPYIGQRKSVGQRTYSRIE